MRAATEIETFFQETQEQIQLALAEHNRHLDLAGEPCPKCEARRCHLLAGREL